MNSAGEQESRLGPGWMVVSRPDAVLHTEILPLQGALKRSLTANVDSLPPAPRRWRRDSGPRLGGDGSLRPPRLARPANLRWWERLAYAWRGL